LEANYFKSEKFADHETKTSAQTFLSLLWNLRN